MHVGCWESCKALDVFIFKVFISYVHESRYEERGEFFKKLFIMENHKHMKVENNVMM